MYDLNSALIAGILFVSMAMTLELGYRVGLRGSARSDEDAKTHVNAIQASLLGVLALLLGFTFSLALQRFDSRSEAVVAEANAIGTTYLRTELLPPGIRDEARRLVVDYLQLRVEASTISLSHSAERQQLLDRSNQISDALWARGVRAAAEEPAVSTSLFLSAVNDMMDAFGRRDAELDRHVPELVLFLLYFTFIMTGTIVGYAAGVGRHRASFVSYIMVALIVLLVFIIIDLDRPRRGLIEVSQKNLIDLQAELAAKAPADPHSASFVISGQAVRLDANDADGSLAPDSASRVVTRLFGDQAAADIDMDGRLDTVALVSQGTAESGMSYYVVAALNKPQGIVGSHGVLLGTGITPQSVTIAADGTVVVAYADRATAGSDANALSDGRTVRLRLDSSGLELREVGAGR